MFFRKGRYGRSNLGTKLIILVISAVIVTLLYGLDNFDIINYEDIFAGLGLSQNENVAVNGDFTVHYIDVGQGDCQLIRTKDKTVLIDTGERENSQKVINYLKAQGVAKIDYLIGTHPHSDHIGGMPDIINSFDIREVIVPEICQDMIPTTKTYINFLQAVSDKGLSLTKAKPGEIYTLDDKTTMEILSPSRDNYDNLNNFSVVTKVTNGKKVFLFTGDMEKEVETELVESGKDLDCDVLKVPHHGSSSSSTLTFLSKASPEYCVIQVGAGNSYNHPNEKTIERLKKYTGKIYRNDLQGTIVCTSDGENLSFTFEKGD